MGSDDLLRHGICQQHPGSAVLPADLADPSFKYRARASLLSGDAGRAHRARLGRVLAVLPVAARETSGSSGLRPGSRRVRLQRLSVHAAAALRPGGRLRLVAAGVMGNRPGGGTAILEASLEGDPGIGAEFPG